MSDRPATQPQPAGSDSPSPRIDAALERGAIVLTPNVRTARRLAAVFDEARRAEGLLAWQPANVLSWTAWAASVWQSALVAGVETRVLLNNLQERALWQRVLQQDAVQSLRPLASQARLCASALRLLGAFDTEDRFGRMHLQDASADAATFARWYRRFQDTCSTESLLPISHLDVEIAALLRRGSIAPAAEYVLYGFDRLTPAQRTVADALQDAGALLHHEEPSREQLVPARLLACTSPDEELQACGAWARQALEAGERVAIVVPDLEAARSELERVLRLSVAPALADVTAGERSAPYEFSTGRPLTQISMVADALRLLQWCSGPVPVADAGAMLYSPHLALSSTPERGAELDAFVLREASARLLRAEVSLSESASIVFERDADTAASLRRMQSAARTLDGSRKTFAFFADESRKLLQRAGWPGAGELSSVEYQAVDRWEEVLDRISTLDLLGTRVPFTSFLEELSDAVGETLFAPENTGAPIQVMSLSEAAGSTFEALWFLHADDGTWPPRRPMQPLLPSALQRTLAMPGSETDRDESEAREAMMRCIRCSTKATFSYAISGAEGHRRPSPLVESVPDIVSETAKSQASPAFVPPLESLPDVTPLPVLKNTVTTGGTGAITAQAQCGFRAWAEHRLGLRGMDLLEAGLSPGERGEQVHTVLQIFWERVKTHAELMRQSRMYTSDGDRERDVTLRECIDAVLPAEASHAWDAAYLQVQRERLFRLLSGWLDREATRPPFEVLHTELEVKGAEVGPLRLDMRVDRVDGVETATGGALLLIDYKTGRVSRNDWKGERMDQPQLPVYATYGAAAGKLEDVRGIAFGNVRVGEDGNDFEEMAEGSLVGNGAKKGFHFDEQVEDWRRDLARLADAFAQGEAAVDPKDHRVTCKMCAQRLLCRLDLTQLEDDDLEDDEEDAPVW